MMALGAVHALVEAAWVVPGVGGGMGGAGLGWVCARLRLGGVEMAVQGSLPQGRCMGWLLRLVPCRCGCCVGVGGCRMRLPEPC